MALLWILYILTYIFKVTNFKMWISLKRWELSKNAQVWLLSSLIFATELDHCEYCCQCSEWSKRSGVWQFNNRKALKLFTSWIAADFEAHYELTKQLAWSFSDRTYSEQVTRFLRDVICVWINGHIVATASLQGPSNEPGSNVLFSMPACWRLVYGFVVGATTMRFWLLSSFLYYCLWVRPRIWRYLIAFHGPQKASWSRIHFRYTYGLFSRYLSGISAILNAIEQLHSICRFTFVSL